MKATDRRARSSQSLVGNEPPEPPQSLKGSNAPGRATGSSMRAQGSRRMATFKRRYAEPVLGIGTILVLLGVWETAGHFEWVDVMFLSRPSDVVPALLTYIGSDNFIEDVLYTGSAFTGGLAASLAIGIPVGALMGRFKWIRHCLDYLISIFYATPRIALVPIIVLAFGIGRTTSIVIVTIMAIFPVLINTTAGIRSVDADLLELARSLRVGQLQLFRWILLPAALPSILAGVRLAIGLSLIGIIVAEFLASTQGLGYNIALAANQFDAATVFAGVTLVAAIGVGLTEAAKRLERHFDRWRLH